MNKTLYILLILLVFVTSACSPVKYVADGEYLLDKVEIKSKTGVIPNSEAQQYIRQHPNLKIFGLFKTNLRLYSLSGKDTTKRINKLLRKIGEKPVIYNPILTAQSVNELQKFYKSKGYQKVNVQSYVQLKDKRANITYNIEENEPYRVRKISRDYRGDTTIQKLVSEDKYFTTKLDSNMLFDNYVLDEERENIASLLRRRGYFYFSKDYLSYFADTTVGNNQVDIALLLKPYSRIDSDGNKIDMPHQQYKISDINITTLHAPAVSWEEVQTYDSIQSQSGAIIHFKDRPLLRPSVLEDNLMFSKDDLYNSFRIDLTQTRLNSLGAIRSAYVSYNDLRNDSNQVTCNITLTPRKMKSISADVELTTTSGDFGFGTNLGWSHRNIFHGSENLGFKVSYSQESMTGVDTSLKRVRDFGLEVSLDFPRVLIPFLTHDFKKRMTASTSILFSYDRQKLSYDRQLFNFSWKYSWTKRRFYNYSFSLFDYNLVKMKNAEDFTKKYLTRHTNPILLYNYTDHQILCAGFGYTFDNQSNQRLLNRKTFRASFELGGNLIHSFRNVFNYRTDSLGHFLVFDVPYSQYVKGEVEYAYNQFIHEKCRIAYHAKLGLAVPYGNSDGVPFEKRFFAGGASGVRGWNVRSLGPGEYWSGTNYLAQTGDVNLLLNWEYRFKMFWKLELALFLDAGNIWTIKEYDEQAKGAFYFNEFYKQMALATGTGLRLDFNYFLIRFDLGMKVHDPKQIDNGRAWRFAHHFRPHNDFAFHFAVGYPF
ncbi:MAG: BamA/TamA family outer membrane protein [Paludibacteraceae bacterium]|nr:BamA/TamA family outer membrane protein [Paludibacteraceae bacterium]